MINKEWYKSKKLWTAVGTIGLVILTDVFGVPIDPETYLAVVGIASSYILGQAAVDVSQETAKAKVDTKVIEVDSTSKENDKYIK